MADPISDATDELMVAISNFSDIKLNVNAGTASGLKYKTYISPDTTGTIECDLETAQMFILKPTGDIVIEFLNPPTTGYIVSLLKITQGGLHQVSWPAESLFASGTAPALSTTGEDLISVQYDSDSGKYWITNIKSDWAPEV